MSKRTILVYVLLAGAWLALLALQIAEHRACETSAKEALYRHARDLSISLGVVIRSQRRFGAVISKRRLEGALHGLAEAREVQGILLLNPVGGIIAKAGVELNPELGHAPPGTTLWGKDTLTVVELAEFGPDPTRNNAGAKAEGTLILDREHRPGGGPPPPGTQHPDGNQENPLTREPMRNAPPEPQASPATPPTSTEPEGTPGSEQQDGDRDPRDNRWRGPHRRRRGPEWTPEAREKYRKWMEAARKGNPPPYPPWMSEEEYRTMVREQGLHKLAFQLDARQALRTIRDDRRQRAFLTVIGLVAVGGLALLYRQMSRSSRLSLQLVRAEATNNHLREMNLAAAGLAHETRNPLNVVRGLAQMLAGEPDNADKARETSERIVGEVDRVSNRLNEFIAYSKPREPVLAPVDLRALSEELGKALASDCEDVRAQWQNDMPALKIRADEGMLRQVLFNILLNSLQAIPEGGVIRLSASPAGPSGMLAIRISDSGPGVPEDIRADIFRPYVSARDKGTGLGLAVVRQIAGAHHWQVDCGVSGDLGGAEFSVTGMQIADDS